MPRVAFEGYGLFEGPTGKAYAVELELLDDSTVRVKKGSKVFSDAEEFEKSARGRGDRIHPWIREAVDKAVSVAKGKESMGAQPNGLLDSSAPIRTAEGLVPAASLYREVDLGDGGATDKALADARARKAAREARDNGPSIETKGLL